MTSTVKRVFHVRYLAHVCYAEILAERSDIRLDKLDPNAGEDLAVPILEAAHAYQVGSARDETPVAFHAHRELLKRCPNLLIVSTGGAGFDTVNVADCTDAGVLVVNQVGGNAEAVAQHVLAMMLTLAKKIAQTDHALRKGTMADRNAYMGDEVQGRTIGIIGFGHIGQRIAELCQGLLGMNVIACDPFVDADAMAQRGVRKAELDTLLGQADYVSVNCPLEDATRGMIGAREFALMKPTAYFITTARGFIHDEKALLEALSEGTIAGAGLDVWDKEPPPMSHPLLQFDNVLASPHTAGVTHEARRNMGTIAAEQLILALDGGRPPRIVNPQVWPAYCERFERILGTRPRDI